MAEGWIEEKGALKKVFEFDTYLHGVNFAVRVAEDINAAYATMTANH